MCYFNPLLLYFIIISISPEHSVISTLHDFSFHITKYVYITPLLLSKFPSHQIQVSNDLIKDVYIYSDFPDHAGITRHFKLYSCVNSAIKPESHTEKKNTPSYYPQFTPCAISVVNQKSVSNLISYVPIIHKQHGGSWRFKLFAE